MAMTLSKRRRIRGIEAAAGGGEGTPDVEEMYRLTDRLCRTPNDAYEAALDTITRALGCSRASILLFDNAGIMRFAAWRGLSEDYCRAVEGHSPWTRDVKDPQPICIQNVEAADIPEFLKDTLKAEQIGALAFFPLVANDALVGKYITYYDARHAFSGASTCYHHRSPARLQFESREGIGRDPKAIGLGTRRQPTAAENQHPTDSRQRC
jgi:GAF domain